MSGVCSSAAVLPVCSCVSSREIVRTGEGRDGLEPIPRSKECRGRDGAMPGLSADIGKHHHGNGAHMRGLPVCEFARMAHATALRCQHIHLEGYDIT